MSLVAVCISRADRQRFKRGDELVQGGADAVPPHSPTSAPASARARRRALAASPYAPAAAARTLRLSLSALNVPALPFPSMPPVVSPKRRGHAYSASAPCLGDAWGSPGAGVTIRSAMGPFSASPAFGSSASTSPWNLPFPSAAHPSAASASSGLPTSSSSSFPSPSFPLAIPADVSSSPARASTPPPPSGVPYASFSPSSSSSKNAPQETNTDLEPYTSALPSYSPLTPHISIGDLAFAEDPELLKREGVTHVVSVCGGRVHIPPHIPPSHRLHVPLADAPFAELVGALGPVVRWVRGVLGAHGVLGVGAAGEALDGEIEGRTGGGGGGEWAGQNEGFAQQEQDKHQTNAAHVRILIHCAHGISRSPAVGAALLVALPLVEVGADSSALVDSSAFVHSSARAELAGGADAQGEGDGAWTDPARICASPGPAPRALPRPFPTSSPPSSFPAHAHASSSPLPLPISSPLPSSSSSPPPRSGGERSPTNAPSRARRAYRTLSAPAALAYVAARRPAADPNWGFRAQLREWEGVCRAREGL
ncbi:hypothetical protein FB451DRAFT_1437818 [Mycena latifolia]|nr:hypothetical protein FB451DRAFT_1437818 [Mycena latifolia]